MQAYRKVALAIAFLIFGWTFGFSQDLKSDSAVLIIKEMAESDIYEVSYSIGYFGSLSLQYQRFEKLLSLASQQQLIDFATNANNPVARLYCYQALRKKKVDIPVSLKQQFSKDITKVKTLKGCTGEEKSVSSLANEDIFNPFYQIL